MLVAATLALAAALGAPISGPPSSEQLLAMNYEYTFETFTQVRLVWDWPQSVWCGGGDR
jgi:hypothetical protein